LQQVDVFGERGPGTHAHGRVARGRLVQFRNRRPGHVMRQVAGLIEAGARGVDQGGGDVGAAEGEHLADDVAEGGQRFAGELARGRVGDEHGALRERGGVRLEAVEQGGAVGGVGDDDPRLAQPAAVIDALQRGPQARQVRLEDDQHAAGVHLPGEQRDVMPDAEAERDDARVLRQVNRADELLGFFVRIELAGECECAAVDGDRRGERAGLRW